MDKKAKARTNLNANWLMTPTLTFTYENDGI